MFGNESKLIIMTAEEEADVEEEGAGLHTQQLPKRPPLTSTVKLQATRALRQAGAPSLCGQIARR